VKAREELFGRDIMLSVNTGPSGEKGNVASEKVMAMSIEALHRHPKVVMKIVCIHRMKVEVAKRWRGCGKRVAGRWWRQVYTRDTPVKHRGCHSGG
jgi:hypothetical protein